MKELIVGILQFVPEKRLGIREIEGNGWVRAWQDLGEGGKGESGGMLGLRKHRMQKSMENIGVGLAK